MTSTDLDDAPKGLGGWLILVGIGVVLNPITLIFQLYTLYYQAYLDGTFTYLTDPSSSGYHPYWMPFLAFEIIGNLIILGVAVWLVYLYFSKHRRFPKTYIFLQVSSLIFLIADAWLITLILPDLGPMDPETLRDIGRAVGVVAIWVPYMLLSKRVKATFVEGGPVTGDDDIAERFL